MLDISVCIECGMSSIRYASNYATSCLFGSRNGVRIVELSGDAPPMPNPNTNYNFVLCHAK